MGALIVATATALAVAGCGGGSSSSGDSSEATAFHCAKSPASKGSGSETGAKFSAKGSNAKIVNFGEEAAAEEREAASCVVEASLKARQAGEFGKQCETLSAAALKRLAEESKTEGISEDCAASLTIAAQPLPQTELFRANTMTGPIAVLRVKGKVGYALYHGTEGKDYAVEMEKEGDEWKVARLATTELP